MQLSGHEHAVTALRFHPAGELLVSGSEDRGVRIWDIHSGTSVAELRHHKERITSLQFSTDGNLIFSSDSSDCTALWHASANKLLYELEPAHAHGIFAKGWIGPKLFSKFHSKIRADVVDLTAPPIEVVGHDQGETTRVEVTKASFRTLGEECRKN